MRDLGKRYCGKQAAHLGRGGIGDGGGFDHDLIEEGRQGIGKGGDAEGQREVDDGHSVGDGQAAIGDNEGIGVAQAGDGAGERGIAGRTYASVTSGRADSVVG